MMRHLHGLSPTAFVLLIGLWFAMNPIIVSAVELPRTEESYAELLTEILGILDTRLTAWSHVKRSRLADEIIKQMPFEGNYNQRDEVSLGIDWINREVADINFADPYDESVVEWILTELNWYRKRVAQNSGAHRDNLPEQAIAIVREIDRLSKDVDDKTPSNMAVVRRMLAEEVLLWSVRHMRDFSGGNLSNDSLKMLLQRVRELIQRPEADALLARSGPREFLLQLRLEVTQMLSHSLIISPPDDVLRLREVHSPQRSIPFPIDDIQRSNLEKFMYFQLTRYSRHIEDRLILPWVLADLWRINSGQMPWLGVGAAASDGVGSSPGLPRGLRVKLGWHEDGTKLTRGLFEVLVEHERIVARQVGAAPYGWPQRSYYENGSGMTFELLPGKWQARSYYPQYIGGGVWPDMTVATDSVPPRLIFGKDNEYATSFLADLLLHAPVVSKAALRELPDSGNTIDTSFTSIGLAGTTKIHYSRKELGVIALQYLDSAGDVHGSSTIVQDVGGRIIARHVLSDVTVVGEGQLGTIVDGKKTKVDIQTPVKYWRDGRVIVDEFEQNGVSLQLSRRRVWDNFGRRIFDVQFEGLDVAATEALRAELKKTVILDEELIRRQLHEKQLSLEQAFAEGTETNEWLDQQAMHMMQRKQASMDGTATHFQSRSYARRFGDLFLKKKDMTRAKKYYLLLAEILHGLFSEQDVFAFAEAAFTDWKFAEAFCICDYLLAHAGVIGPDLQHKVALLRARSHYWAVMQKQFTDTDPVKFYRDYREEYPGTPGVYLAQMRLVNE